MTELQDKSLEQIDGNLLTAPGQDDLRRHGGHRTVGFVGLGVMGSGMARCLLRRQIHLHVHSRRDQSAAPIVAAGAKRADTLKALARAC